MSIVDDFGKIVDLLRIQIISFAIWVAAILFSWSRSPFTRWVSELPYSRFIPALGLFAFIFWISTLMNSFLLLVQKILRDKIDQNLLAKTLKGRLNTLSKPELDILTSAISDKKTTFIHRPNNANFVGLMEKGFMVRAGNADKRVNVAFIIPDYAWKVIEENADFIFERQSKLIKPELTVEP